jgi:AcrR family transcriptional regulator
MTLSVREHVVDDSRADILRAAAVCFMERGYNAASIDDVARRLGATKGRIYHHFPSKADLFAEVYRTGMEMNYAAIQPLRALPLPTVEKWRRMARAHVYQMIRTRPFQRAVCWSGCSTTARNMATCSAR